MTSFGGHSKPETCRVRRWSNEQHGFPDYLCGTVLRGPSFLGLGGGDEREQPESGRYRFVGRNWRLPTHAGDCGTAWGESLGPDAEYRRRALVSAKPLQSVWQLDAS